MVAIDYTTDVGQVRLLISDTDEANQLLSDEQIKTLLNLESGLIKLAAAQALCTIAASEVLISKKLKTQDLATDGPAVCKALRDLADGLRKQAKQEQDEEDGKKYGYGLEIVDFDPYYRQGL